MTSQGAENLQVGKVDPVPAQVGMPVTVEVWTAGYRG